MVERSCNCFIHRCSSSAIVSMAQGFGHFWVLFTAFASACKWFYTISWASDQCNLQRMRWSATHHLLRVERNVTRISGRTFLLKEREERKEERGAEGLEVYESSVFMARCDEIHCAEAQPVYSGLMCMCASEDALSIRDHWVIYKREDRFSIDVTITSLLFAVCSVQRPVSR